MEGALSKMEKLEQCLYCERNSDQTPLIALEFKSESYSICPQHLPILIHDPTKLADKLPGAEDLQSAEGHHH
jgi:hypothetical protein